MKEAQFPEKSDFRVVVIPPMGFAYTAFVEGDLDSMQGIVGGCIEHINPGIGSPKTDDRQIDFWCNEEFLYADDMVFNRVLPYANGHNQPIFGPMFACAATLRDGESHGLTFGEALSVLETPHLLPPHYLLPCSDGMTVQVVSDGAGREFYDLLRDLPDEVKERNNIPLSDEGFARLVPAPLVGKPEDVIAGKWRVHLVYPGERIAGGRKNYGGESVLVGMNLPIVEFWDMSADRTRYPNGWFTSSYYMSTLMNLDGHDPSCERGCGLDVGEYRKLDHAQVINLGDWQVAKQFIEQAHEACVRARTAGIGGRSPSESARAAMLVTQDADPVESQTKHKTR